MLFLDWAKKGEWEEKCSDSDSTDVSAANRRRLIERSIDSSIAIVLP
jgi:hypothetical protein